MSMCPNLVISIPLIITIISRRIKHTTRNPSICPPGASCTAIRPLRIQNAVSMPSPIVRNLMGYEDRACHPVLRGSNPCVCACESGGSFWPRRQRTAQLPCWLKVHLRQVCQRRPTIARCARSSRQDHGRTRRWRRASAIILAQHQFTHPCRRGNSAISDA